MSSEGNFYQFNRSRAALVLPSTGIIITVAQIPNPASQCILEWRVLKAAVNCLQSQSFGLRLERKAYSSVQQGTSTEQKVRTPK